LDPEVTPSGDVDKEDSGRWKLDVRGVRKSYGNVEALAETTLRMAEGEFLTLLGPSGSGKTTLLMMVAGLLPPDAGDIRIDGRLATHLPPSQRDIGMVFQSYALFPHLTIFENIAFPLRMRRLGDAEIRREVARVLEIVQLPDVGRRLPRQLSGGQQQRIALARCIVYSPSIILMDEPLGALDKQLRDQLQIEIKQLHRRLGTSILYVTHDQQETMTLSDRVCLMNRGRIEQIGTPQELYFSPTSIFTAQFLGDSNIFPAKLEGNVGGRLRLRCPALSSEPIWAPPNAATHGREVHILIRPERLSVASTTDADRNVVDGTLSEFLFVGGITKSYVATDFGGTLLSTSLTDGTGYGTGIGSRIQLSWPIDSTIVLPASPQ
jgi:putative spermidine/putrescine transport system ATP-binding protein